MARTMCPVRGFTSQWFPHHCKSRFFFSCVDLSFRSVSSSLLGSPQLGVMAAGGQQLFVGAAFPPPCRHPSHRFCLHRPHGPAGGRSKSQSCFRQLMNLSHDIGFTFHVNVGAGFIEEVHRAVVGSARASASRWHWPPERFDAFSASRVSNPCASRRKSASFTCSAPSTETSSPAFGQPMSRFSRTVP